MATKLSYHVQGWTPGTLDTVLRAKAPALKVMAREHEPIRAVLAQRPETIIILRRYFDDGEQARLLSRREVGGGEAVRAALHHFADVLTVAPKDQIWLEGTNECGLWNDADNYNAFTVGFAETCAEWGIRPAAYSFPVGNPPGYIDGSPDDLKAYWAHYLDGLRAAQKAGGGLALHEYDAPSMRRLEGWLCLRYRKVLHILPDDLKQIPIVITETGIDGGVIQAPRDSAGWRGYVSAEEYTTQLAWYDDELLKDANVLAATIFTAGNLDIWGSFDVTGVWPVADLIAQRGAQSAPPRPTPPLEPPPLPENPPPVSLHPPNVPVPPVAAGDRTPAGILTDREAHMWGRLWEQLDAVEPPELEGALREWVRWGKGEREDEPDPFSPRR